MTTHKSGTREERLKARLGLDHPSRPFAVGKGRLEARGAPHTHSGIDAAGVQSSS
jgi:hypothetical protein